MMSLEEVNKAGQELVDFSKKLTFFRKNLELFIKEIKSLDKGYLQKFYDENRDKEKIKSMRAEFVRNIISGKDVSVKYLEKLRREYESRYGKRMFRGWNNYAILFGIYYGFFKEELKKKLEMIKDYILDGLKANGKFNDKSRVVDFHGARAYGDTRCWIEIFPSSKNYKESYPFYMEFNNGEIRVGLSGIYMKKDSIVFKKNNEFNVNRILKKFLENYDKYKRYNENINVSFQNSPVSEEIKEKTETEDLETMISQIFLTEDELQNIIQILKRKKNIILQGSPGVGKTFIAKRLAYLVMGKIDNLKIEMIQFHQSYSYEDFIQGYRPTEDGKFVLKNGIFYEFCKKAMQDPDEKYFFIIDEINRGNLSKIFGELMMLIEPDKRGEEFSIPLTYSRSQNERFYAPENVYIIGTMNTADRSLAIVDYALRRRFSFIDIEPAFEKEKFKNYLMEKGLSKDMVGRISVKFSELNYEIKKDPRLGKGFQIGHSYFIPNGKPTDENIWYEEVIKGEIAPLLREYWFDDEEKAEVVISDLLGE